MRVPNVAAAGLAATLLASCGGSSTTTTGGTDSSLPTLTVTLSDTQQTVNVDEGASTAAFSFTASYTGTSTQPVVANVTIDAERYQLVGTPTSSGTTFTVNLETLPYSPGGLTTSSIIFRLCTTSDCTSVYPGSLVAQTLYLDVKVKDWETYQRLADHRGFVDVNYKKEDFVRKWQYTTADGSSVGGAVAGRRQVFLTEHAADGHYYGLGIDSTSSSRLWRVDLGTDPVADPAYHDGKVYYIATASSGTKTPIVVDATAGTTTTLPAYSVAGASLGQPVPFGDALHFIAGTTGTIAHAYDLVNATLAWQHDFGGSVMQDATLAADSNYVYSFAGPTIELMSTAAGTPVASFANADFAGGSQWVSAPLLDPLGRVVAFTRSRDFTTETPLASWGIASGARRWISTELYSGAPARGNQYLFAVNTSQRRVDAIDPSTGAIAYSIAIPGTGALTGNLVASRSHLFVATDTDTYAFNLADATHPQDFTAAFGGKLAITPDNLLVISQGTTVTAYRLW
jgi:hypothetical protein